MELQIDGQPVFIATGQQDFDPGKETIVFLHGAGMDHTVWTLFSRYFARRGHNVLAPDLPAHGRSGGEPLPSVPAMAGWVDSVLDALAIERAAIVGHSMGSLIAFEISAAPRDATRDKQSRASSPSCCVMTGTQCWSTGFSLHFSA